MIEAQKIRILLPDRVDLLRAHAGIVTVQIVYKERRDYWINGLVLATVARIVAEGKGVQAGVHFLADAVDPIALMAKLREAGVEQTENLEPSE